MVGKRGLEEALSALQWVANEQGEREGPGADPLLALAIHDSCWMAAAHALAHDRTDVIPLLGDILIPSSYQDLNAYVFESSDIRHCTAFDRSADKVCASLWQWLGECELRTAIARFHRDEDLDAALSEAELLAALRFAQREGGRSYCHIIGAGGAAERSARRHFATKQGKKHFAALLGVSDAQLAETMNEMYGSLSGLEQWPASGTLIPVAERQTER